MQFSAGQTFVSTSDIKGKIRILAIAEDYIMAKKGKAVFAFTEKQFKEIYIDACKYKEQVLDFDYMATTKCPFIKATLLLPILDHTLLKQKQKRQLEIIVINNA